jgi:triosephosphate isomerase
MTPGVRPLIAGNWKMHGTLAEAASLAGAVRDGAAGLPADLLVCPSFLHVASVAALLTGSPVGIGGQDCHAAGKGAHTGDVSASMLKDAGAGFVILGHSERRTDHHETDRDVNLKAQAAATAGLVPIVCVGETEGQRVAGQADAVVGRQVTESIPDDFAGIVAYEPVWAIGTGRTPTEADIAAIHALIREKLAARFGAAGQKTRILYGGSMKPGNAKAILALPNVDGGLVGGASLVAADFLAIARAAG